MFKSTIIAIACLAAVPVFNPNGAMAQSDGNAVTRPLDTIIAQSSTYRRSPEALERQRERERLRRRAARRRQLEWRRKYGDLAPSRQRSERY